MSETFIENLLLSFNSITKKPEKFLSEPNSLLNNLQDSIKQNYDFTKKEEEENKYNSLNELIVKGFDVEQIWQQIELQNDSLLDSSLHNVAKLVAAKDVSLWFNTEEDETKDIQEDIEEDKSSDNTSEPENEVNDKKNVEEESSDDEKSEKFKENKSKYMKTTSKKSVVDDEFFKLDEMEKFLINEEKEPKNRNEDNSDEESVDFFNENEDSSEDESKTNPKYNDFFQDDDDEYNENEINDEVNEDSEIESEDLNEEFEDTLKKFDKEDENSSEDSEDEQEHKSSLEIREERLRKKIEEIEEAAVQEKSWQLKGEITAQSRPQNSLLEEVVEFDLTSRPAPVITQETTLKLEDVIKQRIKDKAFDSVERKIKPVESAMEYKKKLVLDQEKSKQSLAQIYEAEYLKQKESLDPNSADKEEEEPAEHKEVRKLLKSLFSKLDALSNFHFTPKPVVPELKVVNNLPAINMEEVAPVAVSDAALLAPEEIKNKPRGDVIGKGERTKSDKKRERRQKKAKQKQHSYEKQKRDAEALASGKKFNKKKSDSLLAKITKDRNISKMDESSKTVKSSTAFFTQLEDEVKGHIKANVKRKSKVDKPHIAAKKLKL